jgi:hypothetical protein
MILRAYLLSVIAVTITALCGGEAVAKKIPPPSLAEEGIDYPEGSKCPECPFWADRDRFTGEPYR